MTPPASALAAVVAPAPPARCTLLFCDAPATERGYCREHREELNERARLDREEYTRSQRPFWLEQIGLPRRYWPATFADSRPTPSLTDVVAYRDARGISRGRAIALGGPTGVGKTHAFACLVNEALPFLRTSQRFVLAAQLMRDLLDFKSCDDVMEASARVRLLVIDDLQAPARADALALIEELLIRREASGLPVLITTNLRRAQVEASFGDRIADRLRSWGEFHEVPGRSLRGGGA